MRHHLDHIYLPASNLYITRRVLLRGLHLKKSENRSLHAIDILQGSMSSLMFNVIVSISRLSCQLTLV